MEGLELKQFFICYLKGVKIIESCVTYEQLDVAYNYIQQFKNIYCDNLYYNNLYFKYNYKLVHL